LESREEMHAGEVADLRGLLADGVKLGPLGESTVDGRPVVGVRVTCAGFRDVKLYFDKEKHLLAKMETRGKDVGPGNKTYTRVTLYSDYKNVSGLMVAFKQVVLHDQKPYISMELSEVTLSETLPDSAFAKP